MLTFRRSVLAGLLPRASVRLRLTIVFALVVFAAGASIVVSIVLVMTYLPAYRITSSSAPASAAPSPVPAGDSALESPMVDFQKTGDLGLIAVTGPRDILNLLLTTSLIVFGIVLVAGVWVCWIVAGRVLRPIEGITDAARRAATGSLDHRIDLEGPDDEFRRLAATFDDMLTRLDRSFQAQRRFAANASHELRTPLATTQALLDVALLDPSNVDPEDLTVKLRETNTRNIETVEALLALSDAQAGVMGRERVHLDDIAREVTATVREAAHEREIVIHSTIVATSLTGDPALVRVLLSNLVSNAIRYNHTGGDVWLTVADRSIRLENTGPEVTDDDLARLTEPFFRSAGRVRGSHGLGLALVDAIASGHGASLDLFARPGGGLVVEVHFSG